ncbi:MAG: DNA adenine methylase [Bacteroidales bacterium]
MKTSNMNYIGSKKSLLDFIYSSINKIVDEDCTTFCDLFAGTGIVGRYFKNKGYRIIANDIQYYSYVLNMHYIGNSGHFPFKKLCSLLPELKELHDIFKYNYVCEYLSNLDGVKGFIYNNYCPGGTSSEEYIRKYFTDYNGMKCDAIRLKIEEWFTQNNISKSEYFLLLATLLENIDKLANTASVYGAYLKKFKNSALKPLLMKPIDIIHSEYDNLVFNSDINDLIKSISGDILYLDPPYNHRQYATNYHILETISKNDDPQIKGVSGMRDYQYQKSLYCSKQHALESFDKLISEANMKFIFLSYNNEGIMSLEDIEKIMSKRGEYGVFSMDYNRFKADKTENRNHKANKTIEYLHYVRISDNK